MMVSLFGSNPLEQQKQLGGATWEWPAAEAPGKHGRSFVCHHKVSLWFKTTEDWILIEGVSSIFMDSAAITDSSLLIGTLSGVRSSWATNRLAAATMWYLRRPQVQVSENPCAPVNPQKTQRLIKTTKLITRGCKPSKKPVPHREDPLNDPQSSKTKTWHDLRPWWRSSWREMEIFTRRSSGHGSSHSSWVSVCMRLF